MLENRIKDLIPADIPTVIGDLPSTTSNIVAIKLYDGGYNAEYFGKVTVYKPIVKIVARHASYETMRLWISKIQNVLHQYSDDYFIGIHVVGSPHYLGRGEQKLHEMQITFSIDVEE